MTSKETGAALRQARHMLNEFGQVAPGIIGELVARSWERCLKEGLAPVGRLGDVPHLTSQELARNSEHQRELISIARPVLEYVFAQTRDSGSMVVLADNRGMLMQSLGDTHFLNRADRVALAPGASWHECYRGTNAIGTALIEGVPLVVHGGEHYLERNKFLTCAAAPIAAPDGRILGVIDISGDQRSRHPHTLGLARAAAQMIENKLFDARHGSSLKLRFHPLAEGIGTVAEGVIALSEDGWIVGANQAGMALLNLAPANLGATPFSHVFALAFEDLISWSKRRADQPLLIERANAQRLFVCIESGKKLVCATSPTLLHPAPAKDALSVLDTGDPQIQQTVERLRRVAGKQISLIIQGESGVGKELLARASHQSGPRRAQAFIAVNCTALPETLIEAELFGYEAGAYTGARKEGVLGKIREANGGTLFLDEIGDMPLALQGRLLRVLQERQVTPLGSSRTHTVDFNLICATHRNLKNEVDSGRFRSDLYYRLNVLTLTLPPLRARTDFHFIVHQLLDQLMPKRVITLDAQIMLAFSDYPWPGNLRQLSNALKTACALMNDDEQCITMEHLSEDLSNELKLIACKPQAPAPLKTDNLLAMSELMIRQAITTSQGNMSEAARRLGISRNTLYRRIKLGKQKAN